jgi:hypothetical protein
MEGILMVGVIVCGDWFLGEIRDRENELVTIDMGEIFRRFLRSNFPYNVASPAKHKSRTFADDHIRISRA